MVENVQTITINQTEQVRVFHLVGLESNTLERDVYRSYVQNNCFHENHHFVKWRQWKRIKAITRDKKHHMPLPLVTTLI